MSAIAIFCHRNEIQLLSDGLQTNSQTGDVLSTKTKKFYPVNDRCAILNMGLYHEGVLAAIENLHRMGYGDVGPELALLSIGTYMKTTFQNFGVKPGDYLNLAIGYDDDDNPALWEIANYSERAGEYGFSGGDPFEPQAKEFNPGDSIALVVGMPQDKTGFDNYLKTYSVMAATPQQGVKAAFSRMVQDHSDNGASCGGEIFERFIERPN